MALLRFLSDIGVTRVVDLDVLTHQQQSDR
jgi:hypothetical protein